MSVATHRKRDILIPGRRRSERLIAEEEQRARLPERQNAALVRLVQTRGRIQPRGLKRWFIPGSEFEGKGVLTLYANKELRRRRALGKVQKQARKVAWRGRR